MRLINTSSFEIVEFPGSAPEYAILSHRWGETELTLQDMSREDRTSLPGFSKIQGCCNQARSDDIAWVWIDSCCIDKASSAELSEAINSMFQWYKGSKVCYAYLVDVTDGKSDIQAGGHQFLGSEWFKRGWTLQELLAPNFVMFYDSKWQCMGDRMESTSGRSLISLEKLITQATGIENLADWHNASVACKMSWAAGRSTTREEDRAYSLMGLFGVNMPPLYGEGPRAFYRLQLEILRETDDESIFAWADPHDLSGGLMAPSVDVFKSCGGVRRTQYSQSWSKDSRPQSSERPPYSMTNKGIYFPSHPLEDVEESGKKIKGSVVRLPLNCIDTSLGIGKQICIRLERVNLERNQWARTNAETLLFLSETEQAEVEGGNLTHWKGYYIRQLGRYEAPFQGALKVNFNVSKVIARGYEYRYYMVHAFHPTKHHALVARAKGEIQLKIDTLPMSGLSVALILGKMADQGLVLIFDVTDFQMSIKLLGPYTTRQLELSKERLAKPPLCFVDFFGQPNWTTRSRETVLYLGSENLVLRAYLERIWGEGEQGYHVDFNAEDIRSTYTQARSNMQRERFLYGSLSL